MFAASSTVERTRTIELATRETAAFWGRDERKGKIKGRKKSVYFSFFPNNIIRTHITSFFRPIFSVLFMTIANNMFTDGWCYTEYRFRKSIRGFSLFFTPNFQPCLVCAIPFHFLSLFPTFLLLRLISCLFTYLCFHCLANRAKKLNMKREPVKLQGTRNRVMTRKMMRKK